MKKQKLGKHNNTWFLSGETQNTLKIQGVPESALIGSLKRRLGDRIGAEGGKTKLVEMGGKPITAGLSKSVHFKGQQGCVFTPQCNVDPDANCRV